MKKWEFGIILVFVISSIFIAVHFYYLFPYNGISSRESICPLKYGMIECLQGRGIILFFNPSNMTIENISVETSIDPKGKLIYENKRQLKFNETNYIITKNCNPQNIQIKWCCREECYETKFNESEIGDVQIEEMAKMANLTLPTTTILPEESYPPHPIPEDCERLKTSVKNFCYADVAEISGNITYCEKIWDPDIKRFCIARGELDENKCKYIEDNGLRNECIFSINLKKKWLGLNG